jgi:hypothetical protein
MFDIMVPCLQWLGSIRIFLPELPKHFSRYDAHDGLYYVPAMGARII